MNESTFKKSVKIEIKNLFPDSIILPGDANSVQGIPDMIILIGNIWAALEFKKSKAAKRRPNQDYWVNKMNEMSFASFICPENKDEVLKKLKFFIYGKELISSCKCDLKSDKSKPEVFIGVDYASPEGDFT